MLNNLTYIYYLVLFLTGIIGVKKFIEYDNSLKVIVVLIWCSIASEIISEITMRQDLGKAGVYIFYNPIEGLVISTFFLKSIVKRNLNINIILCTVFWLTVGILNGVFLQKTKYLNTTFLIVESFVIIVMSLFALYRILIDDRIKSIIYYPNFLIWVSLLLYFSCTFFYWSTIHTLQYTIYNKYVAYFQIIINIITYSIIGLTLLMHKDMVNKNASYL